MFTERIIIKNVFLVFREFDIKSSVLLPNRCLYHLIGFLSGYLMILS